jgi:hypothetical protein
MTREISSMSTRSASTRKRTATRKAKTGTRGQYGHRLKPLSLLILECDADKLARQALSVAGEIKRVVEILPAKISVEVALINSSVDLRDKFVGYKEKYSSIKVIVVIAHSNRDVISIAPDMVIGWRAFGRWVAPLFPKQMVFVACEAGQYPSTRVLFDEVPKLNKIYASPVKTTKAQADVVQLLGPYLLLSRKQDDDVIRLGQVLNFLRTGGVILRCSRRNSEWNQLLPALGGLS